MAPDGERSGTPYARGAVADIQINLFISIVYPYLILSKYTEIDLNIIRSY